MPGWGCDKKGGEGGTHCIARASSLQANATDTSAGLATTAKEVLKLCYLKGKGGAKGEVNENVILNGGKALYPFSDMDEGNPPPRTNFEEEVAPAFFDAPVGEGKISYTFSE